MGRHAAARGCLLVAVAVAVAALAAGPSPAAGVAHLGTGGAVGADSGAEFIIRPPATYVAAPGGERRVLSAPASSIRPPASAPHLTGEYGEVGGAYGVGSFGVAGSVTSVPAPAPVFLQASRTLSVGAERTGGSEPRVTPAPLPPLAHEAGLRQPVVVGTASVDIVVPPHVPGGDVRDVVAPACQELGLAAYPADCASITAKVQAKYDTMMSWVDAAPSMDVVTQFMAYTRTEYWQSICPDLHVMHEWDATYWNATLNPGPTGMARIHQSLRLDGYFHTGRPGDDWDLPATHQQLAQCVLNLRNHGWAGIYGFLYDEFWLVSARMRGVVQEVLGQRALMMPDVWVFNIDPTHAETHGWGPHRDRPPPTYEPLMPDGSPASLNFWIPLTKATPRNGCMYIYPRRYDPVKVPTRDVPLVVSPDHLSYVRALPSEPGEYFAWDGWVMHWGSSAAPPLPMDEARAKAVGSRIDTVPGVDGLQPPRISVAIEYQRDPAEEHVREMNRPLIPLSYNPSFVTRLRLVAKQLNNYAHIRETTSETSETFARHVDGILVSAGISA